MHQSYAMNAMQYNAMQYNAAMLNPALVSQVLLLFLYVLYGMPCSTMLKYPTMLPLQGSPLDLH